MMKKPSRKNVSRARWNWKNRSKRSKKRLKKTQEYDQEFEKWIKAGKDLIKGEDFIEVEPEEE